jgi:protein ImuB
MSIACLWTPAWQTDEEPPAPPVAPDVVEALLDIVPRVALDGRGMVWADVRGLPLRGTAERLRAACETSDDSVRVGVAGIPVAAEMAARWVDGRPDSGGSPRSVTVVPAGTDRDFLADAPIALLDPLPSLLTLLEGTGLATCGALAVLSREAVEVRFGARGAHLWRLARADDPRRLFDRIPPLRPHASIDFVEYVITDPARLVFTANALITPICEELVALGEHARAMTLTLPLANGRSWSRTLRPGRPTASRDLWLRLIRSRLERLSVPDAVVGVAVEVGATEPAGVRQGDLFDRGFGSASAVEAALSRLVGELGEVVVAPEVDAHPLAERRARWRTRDPIEVADNRGAGEGEEGASSADDVAVPDAPLTLQLLAEPRDVRVDLEDGQPLRLYDRGGWRVLTVVAGPDRVSGGWWEEGAYAREYYRCVTDEGVLVWIYRDATRDRWLLQGWWD